MTSAKADKDDATLIEQIGASPLASSRARFGPRECRAAVELYWTSIETAPPDVALQVRVSDGSSDYLLPYPCKLTPADWVNAATGSPLAVRPTYWKLFVETLPRSKATRRKTASRSPGSG